MHQVRAVSNWPAASHPSSDNRKDTWRRALRPQIGTDIADGRDLWMDMFDSISGLEGGEIDFGHS